MISQVEVIRDSFGEARDSEFWRGDPSRFPVGTRAKGALVCRFGRQEREQGSRNPSGIDVKWGLRGQSPLHARTLFICNDNMKWGRITRVVTNRATCNDPLHKSPFLLFTPGRVEADIYR